MRVIARTPPMSSDRWTPASRADILLPTYKLVTRRRRNLPAISMNHHSRSGHGDMPGTPTAICFDCYVLDLQRCSLRRGNDQLELRPKAFDVLRYLAEN